MKWNWQQPDWPDFRWNGAALAGLEATFLQQSGVLIGSIKHLGDNDRATITIDIMASEALKTSEIEGELLNRDSVQSSLRSQFGLEIDHRRADRKELYYALPAGHEYGQVRSLPARLVRLAQQVQVGACRHQVKIGFDGDL